MDQKGLPPIKLIPAFLISAVAAAILFVTANGGFWTTGRGNAPPLALTPGGPADVPGRIWIDTDAACGVGLRTDPDDCFAIVWLVSRGFDVVGISTSFGNATGDVVAKTVKALGDAMERQGMAVPPVFIGHATPLGGGADPLSQGAAALQSALGDGPLTILALGPLTNVAQAMQDRPDLLANVTRLIAVMGHQPGHIFHPTEAKGVGAAWGHGPIFRDLNLSVDVEAARAVLSLNVPLILIPYDAATGILISGADLELLAGQGPAMAHVSRAAQGWLGFWNDDVGLPGFYPFDWIAAAYLLHPDLFNCAKTRAKIAREWTFWLLPHQALLVGDDRSSGAVVTYCPQTATTLHDLLIAQP